jgi:hypothetical protein
MILSIITGSPGRIKGNLPLETARFSKRDLGASEGLFLSLPDQPRHTYEWWLGFHVQARGQLNPPPKVHPGRGEWALPPSENELTNSLRKKPEYSRTKNTCLKKRH